MNTKILSILIVALLAGVAPSQKMPWVKDFETARATALRTKKLVMIDFYTDWCGWCKKLDQDTYTDAKVIKLADQFVPLKVNAEKEGTALASKYKVNGFPTLLFLDADGQVWGKIIGYVPPAGFIEQSKPVIELHRKYPAVQAALKKNPNDGSANCTMARIEAARGNPERAESHLNRALSAKYAGPDLAKAYNGIGDYYQTQEDFDRAISYFLKGQKARTNPADESYSLVSLMACSMSKRDMDGARKYARMLVNLKGATPEYVQYAKEFLGGG